MDYTESPEAAREFDPIARLEGMSLDDIARLQAEEMAAGAADRARRDYSPLPGGDNWGLVDAGAGLVSDTLEHAADQGAMALGEPGARARMFDRLRRNEDAGAGFDRNLSNGLLNEDPADYGAIGEGARNLGGAIVADPLGSLGDFWRGLSGRADRGDATYARAIEDYERTSRRLGETAPEGYHYDPGNAYAESDDARAFRRSWDAELGARQTAEDAAAADAFDTVSSAFEFLPGIGIADDVAQGALSGGRAARLARETGLEFDPDEVARLNRGPLDDVLDRPLTREARNARNWTIGAVGAGAYAGSELLDGEADAAGGEEAAGPGLGAALGAAAGGAAMARRGRRGRLGDPLSDLTDATGRPLIEGAESGASTIRERTQEALRRIENGEPAEAVAEATGLSLEEAQRMARVFGARDDLEMGADSFGLYPSNGRPETSVTWGAGPGLTRDRVGDLMGSISRPSGLSDEDWAALQNNLAVLGGRLGRVFENPDVAPFEHIGWATPHEASALLTNNDPIRVAIPGSMPDDAIAGHTHPWSLGTTLNGAPLQYPDALPSIPDFRRLGPRLNDDGTVDPRRARGNFSLGRNGDLGLSVASNDAIPLGESDWIAISQAAERALRGSNLPNVNFPSIPSFSQITGRTNPTPMPSSYPARTAGTAGALNDLGWLEQYNYIPPIAPTDSAEAIQNALEAFGPATINVQDAVTNELRRRFGNNRLGAAVGAGLGAGGLGYGAYELLDDEAYASGGEEAAAGGLGAAITGTILGAAAAVNAARKGRRPMAAIRDPDTGAVFVGANHGDALAEAEDLAARGEIDAAIPARLEAAYAQAGGNGPDVGFVRGRSFLTRDEAAAELGNRAGALDLGGTRSESPLNRGNEHGEQPVNKRGRRGYVERNARLREIAAEGLNPIQAADRMRAEGWEITNKQASDALRGLPGFARAPSGRQPTYNGDEVLRLHAAGMTIGQVSAATGVPRDTVGAIIRRAGQEINRAPHPALKSEPRDFVLGFSPETPQDVIVSEFMERFGGTRREAQNRIAGIRLRERQRLASSPRTAGGGTQDVGVVGEAERIARETGIPVERVRAMSARRRPDDDAFGMVDDFDEWRDPAINPVRLGERGDDPLSDIAPMATMGARGVDRFGGSGRISRVAEALRNGKTIHQAAAMAGTSFDEARAVADRLGISAPDGEPVRGVRRTMPTRAEAPILAERDATIAMMVEYFGRPGGSGGGVSVPGSSPNIAQMLRGEAPLPSDLVARMPEGMVSADGYLTRTYPEMTPATINSLLFRRKRRDELGGLAAIGGAGLGGTALLADDAEASDGDPLDDMPDWAPWAIGGAALGAGALGVRRALRNRAIDEASRDLDTIEEILAQRIRDAATPEDRARAAETLAGLEGLLSPRSKDAIERAAENAHLGRERGSPTPRRPGRLDSVAPRPRGKPVQSTLAEQARLMAGRARRRGVDVENLAAEFGVDVVRNRRGRVDANATMANIIRSAIDYGKAGPDAGVLTNRSAARASRLRELGLWGTVGAGAYLAATDDAEAGDGEGASDLDPLAALGGGIALAGLLGGPIGKRPRLGAAAESLSGQVDLFPDSAPRPLRAYHGTYSEFEGEFAPWSHFGTEQAARDRLNAGVESVADDVAADMDMTGRVIPVEIDGKRVNVGDELPSQFQDMRDVAELLRRARLISDEDYAYAMEPVQRYGLIPGDVYEGRAVDEVIADRLREIADREGIGAIGYRNAIEDPGSTSYVVPNPANVRRLGAEILRKYGLIGALGGLGAGAMGDDREAY